MLKCPKCLDEMERVALAAGEVDRCRGCQGMWFDLLEEEDLKAHAAEVDIGSAEKGARYNAVDRIKCPVCPDSPLIRMVDPAQPHIWFESCTTCYGRFLDAGEFRDFAEVTIEDWFKRFSAPARD
jgi:Zn-finger nucleic acid-binding protein